MLFLLVVAECHSHFPSPLRYRSNNNLLTYDSILWTLNLITLLYILPLFCSHPLHPHLHNFVAFNIKYQLNLPNVWLSTYLYCSILLSRSYIYKTLRMIQWIFYFCFLLSPINFLLCFFYILHPQKLIPYFCLLLHLTTQQLFVTYAK